MHGGLEYSSCSVFNDYPSSDTGNQSVSHAHTNTNTCTSNESDGAVANWIYHAMPSLLLPGQPGAPSQSSHLVSLLGGREVEAETWGGGS